MNDIKSTALTSGKVAVEDSVMDGVTTYQDKRKDVEEIKTYVSSNVQTFGKGPDAWQSTTLLSKKEIYGAALVGQNKYKEDKLRAELEEAKSE